MRIISRYVCWGTHRPPPPWGARRLTARPADPQGLGQPRGGEGSAPPYSPQNCRTPLGVTHWLAAAPMTGDVSNLPTCGPLLFLSTSAPRSWGPPRRHRQCTQSAHLWATADFVPRSKPLRTPQTVGVTNPSICGTLQILSPTLSLLQPPISGTSPFQGPHHRKLCHRLCSDCGVFVACCLDRS